MPRYQVSVYRTIGPLVFKYLQLCYTSVCFRQLKEEGTLWDLYKKWFNGPCLSPEDQEAKWNGVPYVDEAREGVKSLIDEKAVSLGRFGGPLVLLLIGALLSLGILVGEVMWVKRYGEV